MNVQQDPKNTDEMSPVEAYAVERLSDVFAQQFQTKGSQQLPIELTNLTGTHLQDINEDCLLEIFSVKSLSLMDLCSLAETCTLFQRIARRLFPKDLKIEYWPFGNDVTSTASRKYLPSISRSSKDIERVLKNFGSIVSVLSISASSHNPTQKRASFIFNLVTKYCAERLERLQITRLEIPAILTVESKPIFKRLQLLHLKCASSIIGNKTLFADSDSLTELMVDRVENCSAFLGNIFPNLVRFTYNDNSNGQRPIIQSLTTFISHHTGLKTLFLNAGEVDERGRKRILEVISSCNELEELSLALDVAKTSDLLPLQALKSLNVLQLWKVDCQDFKFISEPMKLHELHLIACRPPEDLNQFSSFTHLKKLCMRLIVPFDLSDVAGLVRRLTNLEELTILKMKQADFVLDQKTFSEIIAVVEERPHVLSLICKFNFVLNVKTNQNQKVRLSLKPFVTVSCSK